MGLQEEKAALRRMLLEKRAALPDKEGKSRAICQGVLAMPQWQQAERVFLYLSARGEPDTRTLIEAAWEQGKEVLAPVCGEGEGEMAFFPFESFQDLRPGKWGILEPEPRGRIPGKGPGLCLVPGLAFDRQGNRLGYGKGYYDRFLAAAGIESVGLCYGELLFDSLPAGSHDRKVGFTATEAGVSACIGKRRMA